jgi:cell division protein FtsW (lipid II flippase)
MVVTRSSKESRTAKAGARRGFSWGERNREAFLLLLSAAVVLFGLYLALAAGAARYGFGQVDAQLRSGELIHLHRLGQREALLPVLPPFGGSEERAYALTQVWKRLTDVEKGPVRNVGELAKIRVPAAEIEAGRRFTELRERLAERRRRVAAGGSGATVESVSLFSSRQLQELKGRLIVRDRGELRALFWRSTALFLLGFLGVHLLWRFTGFRGDQTLLPLALLLSGLGLVVMVSVRDPLRDLPLFSTFAQGVFWGSVLMAAASRIDFERLPLKRWSFAAFGLSLLLSALLIVFGRGPGISDAKVNLLGFQPVEGIKLLIVLFLAGFFAERWEFLREVEEKRLGAAVPWLRGLSLPKAEYALPPFVALALVLFFFFLQKDLGPALVLSLLFFALYAVARARPAMLVIGLAAMSAAFAVGYKLHFPQTVSGRIEMWLSPWDNGFTGGAHLAQSLWAFASGGLTGTGLGLGDPARVPEVHTDMVLAAIGEQLGFVGVLAVVALYSVLLWRCFRAALRAPGAYTFFLGLGLGLVTVFQILLITGGVLGLLPLSGVVSPLLSYGRSAILANFLLLGMIAAISSRAGDGRAAAPFARPVRILLLVLAIPVAAILLRVAQIQIWKADATLIRGAVTLQADGVRRFQYNLRLEALADTLPRGAIVDRNDIPLATSDPADLDPRSADPKKGPGARALQQMGRLPDLRLARPGDRLYPLGGVAFHVLGDLPSRADWSARNNSYAERDSRIRLQGYDDYAAVVQVRQPDGSTTPQIARDYRELIPLYRKRFRPDDPEVKKIRGRDRTLHLALDARLQLRSAEILRKYVEQAGTGAGGAAVVLDASTGELLANVSYPWPERPPGEAPAAERIDRARYGIYPPGSTFKLVTAMAALRQVPGVTRWTAQCVQLPGAGNRVGNFVRGWGKPIRDDVTDHSPHGTVDLEKGITVSCNAFFAQLAVSEIGARPLLETANLLGIPVAQPNTPERLKDALPQAAYGQGQVIATPFQMARVAATVADGGAMPEGRWVIDDSNTRRAEPVRVISPEQATFLGHAMRLVVLEGTARSLAGTSIAGKTGTAEVGGNKTSHSWFIGYAPFGEGGRKIAFAVLVEHGGYGGHFAAPAAAEIVRQAEALGLLR